MIISILQSNYIPWKGYFDIINKSDVFVIYDEVQYTKNDWRNRNLIKTPNGLQWLTIPVRQETLEQKIFDTKVAQKDWRQKHKFTLQGNYAKAPYFDDYKERFFSLYETSSDYLSEINRTFINEICTLLDIKTRILDSRSLKLEGNKTERLIQACKVLGATSYISGPAAKGYLDEGLFEEEGIKVSWMDYSDYPEYNQLYPPFKHNVSILDLIFNAGPLSKHYLKTST